MSIAEEIIITKVDRIQSELDHQGKQQDKQEETLKDILNKIYSSLTRIEDMIYYSTYKHTSPPGPG